MFRRLLLILAVCAVLLSVIIVGSCGGQAPTINPVNKVLPAVVEVIAENLTMQSMGTGIIVGRSGVILTCQHVVDVEGSGDVTVVLNDGSKHAGSVVKSDKVRDLAVIKLSGEETSLPVASLGNSDESDNLQLGNDIYIVGYPLSDVLSGSATITRGIISAFRTLDSVHVIQTDAAVNPGNSGGPMINTDGEVIGIVESGFLNRGINFAIASNEARIFLASILADVPTVINGNGAANITSTGAMLNGDLTSDGGAATTVTIYWGTSDGGTTPSAWANNVSLGTEPAGAFSDNIAGLTAGTTYYYRCSATNSAGSAWAPTSASFTTSAPAITVPSITNDSGAFNIASTTATLSGSLTSDGGAATTVNVYWGPADGGTTPTGWANNVPLGTEAVGAFTDNITGLTAGMPYYYRCFAQNSAGPAWAPTTTSFSTYSAQPPLPTVPTVINGSGAANITSTGAMLNGDLTSDGGVATTITIYWGTSDGGTTPSAWTNNDSLGTEPAGAFSDNIAGLTPGTTYYYRCSATNSVGSAWSPTSTSFSTSSVSPPPQTCPNVGCTAPDFTLSGVDGKSTTLSLLKGQTVIIVFLKTRCSECSDLMRNMQQVYDLWPSEQLEILVIVSQEKSSDVQNWVKLYKIRCPVLLDPDGNVINTYRPSMIPFSFFVESEQNIRIKRPGPLSANEIGTLLNLLAE
ncbi:MAG: trypsin-like peptidase domain-containing protein [Dehalococcoidia bacterium]